MDGDSEGQKSQAIARPRILLGLSGSVAAIKAVELVHLLSEVGEVKVVTTRSALHFFDPQTLRENGTEVLGDADDWRVWQKKGDPILHIDLRKWADLLVVAPLSANSLAKMAHGLCDNLLTCVVRAWDFNKPMLVAPAMNTHMWDSPFTGRHLSTLRELGVHVLNPVSKTLACGDVGQGALPAPVDIVESCKQLLPGSGGV
mmetsp:Transcript_24001/g.66701  ORF Transcript_24001/g.66701 Transcript_24001/m.66701 type:complete len:201 (+) Transcript_24001:494-1096(+)